MYDEEKKGQKRNSTITQRKEKKDRKTHSDKKNITKINYFKITVKVNN